MNKKYGDNNIEVISNLQKKQLDIFKAVDKVCKKNKIEYFLIDTTCLDAVTKKGFNPYSISFSIGMTRKNYDEFLRIVNDNLKDIYIVSNFDNDKKYTTLASNTKIGLKDTYLKTKSYLTFSHCAFQGIYISINVLDFTSPNYFIRLLLSFFNKIILSILFILDLCYINFIPLKRLHNKIIIGFSKHYSKKNNLYVTTNVIKKSTTLPYQSLMPLKKIKFENIDTCIPNNYEIYLKKLYGNYTHAYFINNVDKKMIRKIDFEHGKEKTKSKRGFYYTIILLIISLLLFNEFSFSLLGFAILIFGVTLLYNINYPK